MLMLSLYVLAALRIGFNCRFQLIKMQDWIYNLKTIFASQVSQEDVQKGNQFIEVLKKIQAKAKLVGFGCFTSAELGKVKSLLLNSKSQG